MVACCCHFSALLQIAALAVDEERLPILGVLYDELFRQYMEELSGKLGNAFNFADHIKAIDENILRRSKAMHDKFFKASRGQDDSWHSGTGVCLCGHLCAGAGFLGCYLQVAWPRLIRARARAALTKGSAKSRRKRSAHHLCPCLLVSGVYRVRPGGDVSQGP